MNLLTLTKAASINNSAIEVKPKSKATMPVPCTVGCGVPLLPSCLLPTFRKDAAKDNEMIATSRIWTSRKYLRNTPRPIFSDMLSFWTSFFLNQKFLITVNCFQVSQIFRNSNWQKESVGKQINRSSFCGWRYTFVGRQNLSIFVSYIFKFFSKKLILLSFLTWGIDICVYRGIINLFSSLKYFDRHFCLKKYRLNKINWFHHQIDLNFVVQNWQQRANKIENLPNNYSTCHLLTEITEISAFDCSVQLSVLLLSSAQLKSLQSTKKTFISLKFPPQIWCWPKSENTILNMVLKPVGEQASNSLSKV